MKLHSGTALTTSICFAAIVNGTATLWQLYTRQWILAGTSSLLLMVAVTFYWLASWFRAYGQLLYDNARLAKETAEAARKLHTAFEAASADMIKQLIGTDDETQTH